MRFLLAVALVCAISGTAHAETRTFTLGAGLGLFHSTDEEAQGLVGDAGFALYGRVSLLSTRRSSALRADLSVTGLLGRGHVGTTYGALGLDAAGILYFWNLPSRLGHSPCRLGLELRVGAAAWAETDDRESIVLSTAGGVVLEVGQNNWFRMEMIMWVHPHQPPPASGSGSVRDPEAMGFLGGGLSWEHAF
jgi:hypothetical protein